MSLWKSIDGHNGVYLISTSGKIFNQLTGKYLTPVVGINGYEHLTLSYGNKEDVMIHRLVATTFLENPNNLSVVNHKDENKLNNDISNLEWCTQKYNVNYRNAGLHKSTAVIQIFENGEQKEWGSIKDAANTLNIKYQGISRVCRGKRKTCGGFSWKYAKKIN